MHRKYFVKRFQTGRYYSAYFLNDETVQVIKQWLGNETLRSISNQKTINLLMLNTVNDYVYAGPSASGSVGPDPPDRRARGKSKWLCRK